MATQSQIQALINQIQTGASYTANALNTLMNNLLGTIFSPFYSAAGKPDTLSNQTQGFKAGSLGVDTNNDRIYACSSSTDSTATWDQITQDRAVSSIVASIGGTLTLNDSDAFVTYSGSQDGVTVNLPVAANSYSGKIVKVYFDAVSTSGPGVEFVVPELSPYTVLFANVYQNNNVIDFIFDGSTWAGYFSSASGQDLQSVYDTGNDINTYQLRIDDSSTDNLYIGKNDGTLSGSLNIAIGKYALNSYSQSNGIGIGVEAGGGSSGNGSISIGNLAGKLSSHSGSISIGGAANASSTVGGNTIAIGTNAGLTNTALNSIFIGNSSGNQSGGTGNIMIGENAGYVPSNTIDYSIFIGAEAGQSAQAGSDYSVSIGYQAGQTSTGDNTVHIGRGAGKSSVGSSNVFLGYNAGIQNTGGNCVFLGLNSGANNTGTNTSALGTGTASGNTGSNCVILGSLGGAGNTISNATIISNNSLPEYASHAAAVTAFSAGSSGDTYLYYNSTNFAIEGVRIP